MNELIKKSIMNSMPKERFALLLSGGIDSTIIAKVLKDSGAEFTCYTSGVSDESGDVVRAKRVASELGLNHKCVIIKDAESLINEVITIIKDSNVIKVGVSLPLLASMREAKRDGYNSIFIGNGADELFGGYHKYRSDLNQSRDDVLNINEDNRFIKELAQSVGVKIIEPYLSKEIIDYALNLNSESKIKGEINKYALRQAGLKLGAPSWVCDLKKTAAQYGSGVDKEVERLAKKRHKGKSEYLNSYFKLGALISSGKDSLRAMHLLKNQGYDFKCLITIKSDNPDSFMYHTPTTDLVKLQADAIGLPLITQTTKGEKEEELADLKTALNKAKDACGIMGVSTGALYSEYQASRIIKLCDELGLKVYSPLWHADQEEHFRSLIKEGFKIIFTKVAAEGLDSLWLGRVITEDDVNKLVALKEKYGINVAGEGGEYESLVLDCPLFNDELIIEYEVNNDELLINKARLSKENI